MSNRLTYFIRSDIAEVGRDPEEGTLITGEVFYVVAEDSLGYRYAHAFSSTDEDEVKNLLKEIMKTGMGDGRSWVEIEPAYGSRAYQYEESYIVEREREEWL